MGMCMVEVVGLKIEHPEDQLNRNGDSNSGGGGTERGDAHAVACAKPVGLCRCVLHAHARPVGT
eukprot:364516-Chlamydomonas_euryale.AAC.16